ncbi:MAG: hypothetical protein KFKLKKLM_00644 [Flavobacteriales bacterium]|nr:hypothetical protein [Flavobacteriales bacterium]
MKILFFTIFILFISNNIKAQNDTLSINQAITQLFDGMRTSDSNLVKSVFYKDATLQTVFTTKTGETKLHEEQISEFAKAVGTPHDGVWNEKITKTHIQIDGALAHAWTNYEFFVDDKFIHCGVNSFQLMKTNNGWKIISIVDTRRTTNCN